MNDVSRSIASIVHAFNAVCGRLAAAYTYDAGPNAVIYAMSDDMRDLVELFTYCFPRDAVVSATDFYADPFGVIGSAGSVGDMPSSPSVAQLAQTAGQFPSGSVRRIIHTEVGDGPRVLSASQSLLDDAGMPKRAKE
ncbi:diphosphomevalonate decarboxylase [Coemansia sp. RSA 1933]|nr:diphosphomevalonate decarboxylase [Coemansia sp. RSA 1933]